MQDQNSNSTSYVLGLDLGVSSIGWAIRPKNPSDLDENNLKMGARIFDLAVEAEGGKGDGVEQGKDMPKNAQRRAARSARRRLLRRARRKTKLFNILVRAGLLPDPESAEPEKRQDALNELDKKLMKEYFPNASNHEHQTYSYQLRALALQRELSPYAFGRALYALAQRRGFKSNKKLDGSEKEKDKETSEIKRDIQELDERLHHEGKTLGEFFAQVEPEKERIRARWVGRQSYYDEFQAIWAAQAKFQPELLNEKLKEKIEDAIFFQRPLRSQKGKIAKCELELNKDGKRYLSVARKGEPCFQKFRVWEKIINLRVWDGNVEGRYDDGGWRPLTRQEQDVVFQLAEQNEKVSYIEIRKELGLSKLKKGAKGNVKLEPGRFNMEIAEEELIGDRTSARIRKALEEFNITLTQAEIDQAALYILDYENEDGLRKRLKNSFSSLTEEAAEKLAKKVVLEDGYAAYSSKAIQKLLDFMIERRQNQMVARLELYPAQSLGKLELLPPLVEAIGDIRNPIVTRTLAEMRKVVNAIIRRYGKPAEIYVELARDLKKSRKQRASIFADNKARDKDRQAIEKRLRDEFHISKPTSRDVLKYRLWRECNGQCPYTGKEITGEDLFSESSHFDIEHIIPFSRSFDDSFANKTLCYAEENRNVKKNRTPFECYHGSPQYDEIKARVANFKPFSRRKYELFTTQQPDNVEEISHSLLNDTRYISKLATQYLGLLYGAVNGCVNGEDEESGGKRVIFANTGKVTAWLRREWKLNEILVQAKTDAPEDADVVKNRADHRHHAIDALAISLSTSKIVKELNNAAKQAETDNIKRLFTQTMVLPPVPEFKELVRRVVDGIVVSKRVDSKVRGQLHEETNLGAKAYPDPYAKKERRKKRVAVENLTSKQLDDVVDPGVRRAIQEKLKEVGDDPKKLADNPPSFKPNFGVLIHKTVIWETSKPIKVGKGRGARFVKSGDNHHMEFYAVLDEEGKEIEWKFKLVTLYEAYERKRMRLPIVQRKFGEKTKFKFSLVKGDAIREKSTGKLYFIAGLSTQGEGKGVYITGSLNTSAKPITVLKEEYSQMSKLKRGVVSSQEASKSNLPKEIAYFRSTNLVDFLKRFEKVRIDPLGNVEIAND